MKLSTNLRELRKQNNFSLNEVATHLNVTASAISRFELGEREPNIEKLIKLADLYKVSTDFLLGRTNIDNTGETIFIESISTKVNLIQKQLDDIKEMLI